MEYAGLKIREQQAVTGSEKGQTYDSMRMIVKGFATNALQLLDVALKGLGAADIRPDPTPTSTVH
jgi:hypothetical protein